MSDGPERMTVDGASSEDVAFERELTVALRSLRVPADFGARIAAHAEGGTPQRMELPPTSLTSPKSLTARGELIPFRSWRVIVGGAIAAALLAGVFATEDVRGHREHARRQTEATQQFETATRITDQAMAHTREELERAGALRGD